MLITKPRHFWEIFLQKYFNVDPLYKKLMKDGVVEYDSRTGTYIRDVKGNKLHLNPEDMGISRALAQDGIREKESVHALYRHVNPDMIILDIGANIGFYVVLEAQIVTKGKGRIIAVEPAPENVRLLKLSIHANNYNRCINIFQSAISDITGTVELELSCRSNSHQLATLYSNESGLGTIDVPALTLDDLMKRAKVNMEEIDFLRMDVEGAEYIILPTIYDFLEQKRSFLMFIEFHPHTNPEQHKEVLRKLDSFGFRCLSVTKEYIEDDHVVRSHRPNTSIRQLYEEEFFLQFGGCEVFLKKE